MNALDQMQEISDKVDAVRNIAGTIEDCPEAYMAEMRVDINELQNHIANMRQMIQSQKVQAYNTRVGLITLCVIIVSGSLTYLTI